MKGKRVIITISQTIYEQLQEITRDMTPREKSRYLKIYLEDSIQKNWKMKKIIETSTLSEKPKSKLSTYALILVTAISALVLKKVYKWKK